MRLLFTVLMFALLLSGCSSVSDYVAPSGKTSKIPDSRIGENNRWAWNSGLYWVSEDHTTIERLPHRVADWHINVNTFVEPPFCNHCLAIGKPQLQPDGTFKVKVILTHPFPGQPQYTGFDVRGTVIFPATRYWKTLAGSMAGVPPNVENPFFPEWGTPLHFSRAEDGGGQLVNADGYSIYLFPGLDLYPHWPITQYSRGKHANGPDPDSTVNGYKLFTNDPERRMFQTTDTISRTYHIDPPDGSFTFGYVVDASWVAPTKTPVTDPKTDFPFWANCEDPYVLEFEQLGPFKTGAYNSPTPPLPFITRQKILTHTQLETLNCPAYLICPDIVTDLEEKWKGVADTSAWSVVEKLGPGVFEFKLCIRAGTYEATPGFYLAVVYGTTHYWEWPEDTYPIQFLSPPFVDFIMLEVVEGD